MEGNKNTKKSATLDGMDLVEWFLAIDACFS